MKICKEIMSKIIYLSDGSEEENKMEMSAPIKEGIDYSILPNIDDLIYKIDESKLVKYMAQNNFSQTELD